MTTSLREALQRFVDVSEAAPQSSKRNDPFARYCIHELDKRGLVGARVGVSVPGAARDKRWDVAWSPDRKVRLAISITSLASNLGGSVPNRLDELIGATANAQAASPEIVLGHLLLVDQDLEDAESWTLRLRDSLNRVNGRRPPAWAIGSVEAYTLLRFTRRPNPQFIPGDDPNEFLDALVACVRDRYPAIDGYQPHLDTSRCSPARVNE
ncbi:MAG: hypothetical protein F4180_07330 [Chloroflexi bacterium]|nr:hypothetical protein [Chloroflexota bacterium]